MSNFAGLRVAVESTAAVKEADTSDWVDRLRDAAGSAGKNIGDWYQGNPEVRGALLRGAGGAAVGGLAAGGMSALTPRDQEAPSPVLRDALMGALLGGGAAAALPAGLRMLGGKTRFSGEPKPGILGSGFNVLAKPFEKAPFLTAGAAAGAGVSFANRKNIRAAMNQAQARGGYSGIRVQPSGNKFQVLRDMLHNKLLPLQNSRAGMAAKNWHGAFGQMDDVVDAANKLRQTRSGAAKASMGTLARKSFGGKLGLVGIPAGIILGALADSYAKGRMN